MLHKYLYIVLSVCFFCLLLPKGFAQGEIEEVGNVVLEKERSFGVYLNSNGLAADFRFAKRLDGFRKRFFEYGFGNIKHPKETKSQNADFDNDSFVFGKLNHFIPLHAGIGRQKEIFSKFDKGGIAIRYFYSGGLSLGLQKPIYYEVIYAIDGEKIIIDEKFDPAKHHSTNDIFGKASFFAGIPETKLVPGLYLKAGFSFEYSKMPKTINSIDVGVAIDAYYKEIPIMATSNNQQVFLILFVSYRFGKLSSGRTKNDTPVIDLDLLDTKE